MKTKHTPGPWETNGDPYVSAGNRSIAFCDTRDGGDEDKANARLIAAAPEMFEALKAAHHMLTRDYIDPAKMRVVDQCDAAIARATGEQP